MFIMFFFNIRHKQLYKKIKLLPETIKDYTITEKSYYFLWVEVVHLTFPPQIFVRACKVWSMLHHRSVGLAQNNIKETLTLNLTFNLLLLYMDFHNNICAFIMIFTAWPFLRLIHGLFFMSGGNVRYTLRTGNNASSCNNDIQILVKKL